MVQNQRAFSFVGQGGGSMTQKQFLLIALVFPILSLGALTIYKQHKVSSGTEVVIPIVGYDPRDLLSGHYLIYQLRLDECQEAYLDPAYMCVRSAQGEAFFSQAIPDLEPDDQLQCDTVIQGQCQGKRFEAGIERFYIPEAHSQALDRIIRSGKGKLVVSVDNQGKAVIKDLLINDRPWQEYLSESD